MLPPGQGKDETQGEGGGGEGRGVLRGREEGEGKERCFEVREGVLRGGEVR